MKKELPERIIGRFKSVFCGQLIVNIRLLMSVQKAFLLY